MVVGVLDALANGAITMAKQRFWLRRLLQRLQDWLQTLRQASVLLLWLPSMVTALKRRLQLSRLVHRLRQAVSALAMALRLSALRLRLAQMRLWLSAALLRLAQRAQSLRQQLRFSLEERLLQPLLRLQQAAVKSALALQRSTLKAYSRLLAKLSGKHNQAQAQTTKNKPPPAQPGNGQREE